MRHRRRFLPQMDVLSTRLAPSTVAAVPPAGGDYGDYDDMAAPATDPGDDDPGTDDQDLSPDNESQDYPPDDPMAPYPLDCTPYTAASPVYATEAY